MKTIVQYEKTMQLLDHRVTKFTNIYETNCRCKEETTKICVMYIFSFFCENFHISEDHKLHQLELQFKKDII